MKRFRGAICLLAGLWSAALAVTCAAGPIGTAAAQTVLTQEPRPAPPDYNDAADWVCRPGGEDRCTRGLDATSIAADGHRTPEPFRPAANPPIDCFYVYPTVSREPQDYADLTADEAIVATVRAQAGRLASRCRLFAPLYRQATLRHLRSVGAEQWDGPYRDIVAAWQDYLTRDNHGRGVVLVGHSQGTILLQRLIAEHIDGQPTQSLLVAAFLSGNPGLEVPRGATVGGTFGHIPVCTSAAQTGCAYAWSSYLDRADDGSRAFGRDRDGLFAACTNPAAPGGAGALDAIFPGSRFPAGGDAPFVRLSGQIGAVCRRDPQGSVLRITVLPGVNAAAIEALLDREGPSHIRDWGLHPLDLALAQGSILKLLDAETASWRAGHHR